MNYKDTHLEQMFCDDFIKQFEGQYPDTRWEDVQNAIFKMFKEMFEGATSLKPPCGIAHSPQSRAMYAADLMLSWKMNGNERKMEPK